MIDLRNVKTFDDLVVYLRDELDWPIEDDSIEDITYDYSAEELGIDPKNAVKIRKIKQLRPLTTEQRWGIFFIDFEPKRLPVVVLRRILRSLIVKKRAVNASANAAAWEAHDLLFISSFGASEARSLTFAHFSEDPNLDTLPVLRVLGWDDKDTVLHLSHAHDTLRSKLTWPRNKAEQDAWRARWAGAFTLQNLQVIKTSKELAVRLADLAKNIRERVKEVMGVESHHGELKKLHKAFQETLMVDFKVDRFADMYAQTIAYGLLTARLSRPAGVVQENLADMVPITNPFLKEMLGTFLKVGGRRGKIDFDELGVNDVVDLLNEKTDMQAVLHDFGDRNQNEDPVTHFYELFLNEYDSEKRKRYGVYYTPRSVVSYIVESVDELLRSEFGLEDGLADTTTWGELEARNPDVKIPVGTKPETPFVQILDPATGTGTFLVEVIETIHKTMVTKWKVAGKKDAEIRRLWNEYVPKHLLPRLHGYELLMAPYAIAHMKIPLVLKATGFTDWSKLTKSDRVKIYLTNTLEKARPVDDFFTEMAPLLAVEAKEANKVKEHSRITVIVGNPPYSSSISEPSWLMEIMGDWKKGLNETKSDLNREEWKFVRFSKYLHEVAGIGILGFIINRDIIDGGTKRKMREDIAKFYSSVEILDLNGDVLGDIPDENVFDIKQGVCILLFSKAKEKSTFSYLSITGKKEEKLKILSERSLVKSRQVIHFPKPDHFLWKPFLEIKSEKVFDEYHGLFQITEIFKAFSSGFETQRDSLTINFTKDELLYKLRKLISSDPEIVRAELEIGSDGRDWKLLKAIEDIKRSGLDNELLTKVQYRVFDFRWTYWTGKSRGFIAYPKSEVLGNFIRKNNIGLMFNRQIVGNSVSHFFISKFPVCKGTFYLGNKGQDYIAPLYIFNEGLFYSQTGELNFQKQFLAEIENRFGNVSGVDVFNYICAIFYSKGYRIRYSELLKIEFPRIPLTNNYNLFDLLAKLGSRLIECLSLETKKYSIPVPIFKGNIGAEVSDISFSENSVWIDKLKSNCFYGVSADVWDFQIGGYQICHKWLKDRKGRTLSAEDIAHYQKIVVALSETIRIMGEIDEVIDAHGGWPLK